MQINYIRGFKDILPDETPIWQRIECEAKKIFHNFGYGEVKLPILEKTEVFTRSIGEYTDIVEKEMYTFLDKNGESITLRPEGTASVVRAIIQHKLYRNKAYKCYYMGPMFRYERPQKGRYRQFHQIGAEVFGIDDPMIDAELIFMLNTLFDAVQLHEFYIELNSLGCGICRESFHTFLISYLDKHYRELCEDCKRRVNLNPLRVLDCKNEICKEIVKESPSILGYLCESCHDHFEKVKMYLNSLGVTFTVNNAIVRGLDYYNRTIFEFKAKGLGSQNAVAAGGRYDLLVEMFGGPPTPALGFAIGLERLVSLVDGENRQGEGSKIFVAYIGDKARDIAFGLVNKIRKNGMYGEIDICGGSLKSQLKYADKCKSDYSVIIGENEIESGNVIVRDMKSGHQKEYALNNFIEEFLSKCRS
ncbi:MAG: histidine--tRNA ligase [Thermodesulfobacteriota bacterium]|nr:histidine--tRNA ligase [Thermodesulfobacteriota bacterium]